MLESKLDSLFLLLPEASKRNNDKFLILKDKLGKEKAIENNLLCSIIDDYSEPNISLNIGLLLNYSSESYISLNTTSMDRAHKNLGYFYNIPANIGLGLSLSLNIKIIETLSFGIEFAHYRSHSKYIGVFLSSYNDDKPKRYSSDIYGYKDLDIEGNLYSIYSQYKFSNRTIFHPFL